MRKVSLLCFISVYVFTMRRYFVTGTTMNSYFVYVVSSALIQTRRGAIEIVELTVIACKNIATEGEK